MNYKQIGLTTLGLIALVFIKQILLVCGAIYVFKFIKANLLFASDREIFMQQFLGVDKTKNS